MSKKINILSKRYMIEVTGGGVLTYRDKQDKTPTRRLRKGETGPLPIFSVDTEDEATFLQLTFCRRSYETNGDGSPIYVVNEIGNRALAGKAPELTTAELPGFVTRFEAALERRSENIREEERLTLEGTPADPSYR